MHFNLIAVTALIATLVNASAIRLIPRNMDITPELAKRETVTQAKMIGDAGYCLTGTSFCCIPSSHRPGTVCAFDSSEGTASRLKGCETQNGGKSVCCSGADKYCHGMTGLEAPITFSV